MRQTQADRDFMEEALNEARTACFMDEVPVGCVVVQAGKIIARAHNEREKRQDMTAHAEILALRRAARHTGSWRLEDCDIYVTLEPCMMCTGALIQARVRRLVYAARDPKSGMAGSVADLFSLPANHRLEVLQGPGESEASALLTGFFRARRKDGEGVSGG